MRKPISLFFTVSALLFLLIGCSKQAENTSVHEEMTVSLNLTGDFDVDVTQDPLTRATSTNDAYGINVYYDKEGDGTTNDIYAYGLFDNVADMTITLLSNHKYKFICSW